MRLRSCFFAVTFCLLIALTVHGQSATSADLGDRPATSYFFVSPNTDSNLTLSQAIERLRQPDERALVKEARQLAQCLGIPARTQPAVGNWREGSEQSSITREWTRRDRLRYQAARLGARWRQISVLLFRNLGTGPHRMYVLRPRHSLGYRRMSGAMERAGIAFRTLVRERSGRSVVYVVEMSDDLGKLIRRAARSMNARLRTYAGEGEFFGADDRERAQTVFGNEIRAFETANPDVKIRCR